MWPIPLLIMMFDTRTPNPCTVSQEPLGMYPNEVDSNFAFMPFGGGQRKCVGDQVERERDIYRQRERERQID